LRDLRDEICRALDVYFALGGAGIVGEFGLAEHVNPPRRCRVLDAEQARKDLERVQKITLMPVHAPQAERLAPQRLQQVTLSGVELMAERSQTRLKADDVEEQARRARQKFETRTKAGKKHNADIVVTLCLRWGFLGHLGAAKKTPQEFFGPLYDAAIVPCPAHEWDSLLGGLRMRKDKAPPVSDQEKAVALLRQSCVDDPPKALELLAPWFGTVYARKA
jgi:hypothetical protein